MFWIERDITVVVVAGAVPLRRLNFTHTFVNSDGSAPCPSLDYNWCTISLVHLNCSLSTTFELLCMATLSLFHFCSHVCNAFPSCLNLWILDFSGCTWIATLVFTHSLRHLLEKSAKTETISSLVASLQLQALDLEDICCLWQLIWSYEDNPMDLHLAHDWVPGDATLRPFLSPLFSGERRKTYKLFLMFCVACFIYLHRSFTSMTIVGCSVLSFWILSLHVSLPTLHVPSIPTSEFLIPMAANVAAL